MENSAFLKYFLYCGLDKEGYKRVKRDAYIANFEIWKKVNILITLLFGVLFVLSMAGVLTQGSVTMRGLSFLYFTVMLILFYTVIPPDSLIGQLLIYVEMIIMLIFGLYLSYVQPEMMGVTFMVFLVGMPMFMIDHPFYMTLLLFCSAVIYILVVSTVKTGEALSGDIINALVFSVVGAIVNTVYNTFRVREFVLTHEIEKQRDTDELTGLLSKRGITSSVDSFIEEGTGIGVLMMLDVDKFKKINDSYGHDAGDKVLKDVGECLRSCLTQENGAIIGRYGGDEFVVCLPGLDGTGKAEEYAGSIIGYANRRIHTPNYNEHIELCIGIASFDANDMNFDTIFKKADIALYEAKTSGRNRCCVYRSER